MTSPIAPDWFRSLPAAAFAVRADGSFAGCTRTFARDYGTPPPGGRLDTPALERLAAAARADEPFELRTPNEAPFARASFRSKAAPWLDEAGRPVGWICCPEPCSAAPEPRSAAPDPRAATPDPRSAAPKLRSAAPAPSPAAPELAPFINGDELQAVLDAIPIPAVFGDERGVIRCNSAVVEGLGLDSAADVCGAAAGVREKLQHEDPETGEPIPPERMPVMRAARGETVRMDVSVRHAKTGARRRLRAFAAPVRVRGRALGSLSLWIDRTAEAENERALRESEDRLRLALERARGGTWHVDLRAGRYSVSSALADILGIADREGDPNQALAKSVHPDDRERVTKAWSDALEGGAPYAIEYRALKADGTEVWLYASGKATRGPDGRAETFSGVALDVTAMKRAEEAARSAEERLRAYAESSMYVAFLADAEGRPTYCSKSWYDYVGLSRPDDWTAVADRWLSFVHPDDVERVSRLWRTAVADGSTYAAEFRLRRHDGQHRWHQSRAVARKDRAGRVLEWYGTCVDIHDQKLHAERLERARDEAESASRSKSAFLANMSHEIRTPLGAILGFSELLAGDAAPEQRREWSEAVARNGRALTRIIDDILDLSKVEAGRLDLELAPTRIDELAYEATSMFQAAATAKGISLSVSIDGALPSWIRTDAARLRQILVNLVGNAVKFTESGSIRVRAKPAGSADAPLGLAAFEIEDTGIGITEDQAARLFENFSQVDGSATRRFGGAGLGLSLSRRLARALGGDVRLERSVPGKGSTFVATVAAMKASVDDVLASREAGRRTGLPWAQPAKPGSIRALVVDDCEDNRRLVGLMLRAGGVEADFAANGAQGVAMAEAGDYDVVLMDMQMPVLDGYSAVRSLRSRGYRKPILAVTAHAMAEERIKTRKAGCDDHLTKPIDRAALLEAIAFLTRSRDKCDPISTSS